MNDLKKTLKTQAKDALPDPSVKERVRSGLGIAPTPAEEQAYAHGGTRSVNKKKWLPVLAAGLALVLALCILLPVLLSGGGNSALPPTLSAAGDFYAYSAASAGALLSQSGGQAGAKLRRSLTAAQQQEIEDTTDEYLRLIESLLSDGSITHEAVAVPEKYAQYSYAMKITSRGIAGGTFTYTLYYSEALTGEETDGDETERAYDITGVLAVDGTDYPVRGGKEQEEESEGGESESESELWFEAYTGENSYLRIEQEEETESEEGETETERTHRLRVFEDGRCVEDTTIDYEEEDGEAEIKLTILRGERRDVLQCKRDRRADALLYAEADFGGIQATFRIYIENGAYRYEFTDED